MSSKRMRLAAAAVLAGLAGCGGGGGSGGGEPLAGPPPLAASITHAQQCAPTNTLAADSLRSGSIDTEKQWLRSYMNEAYLWHDEVPVVDAGSPQYSSTWDVAAAMDAYFHALLTPRLTASGKYQDQFSFTHPTAAWKALIESGSDLGYGADWAYVSTTQPREIRVANVLAGTAAATAGLRRGDLVVLADGHAVATSEDTEAIYEALLPSSPSTHTFTLRRLDGTTYSAVMNSALITKPPVPLARSIATTTGKVGYVVFNDHNAPSEAALIAAVNQLKTDGISDLVLDMRYNGGGYLSIASQLAYMIAGPATTTGKTFEKLTYSTKRSADNARAAVPFYNAACLPDAGGYCSSAQPLPTLGLSRVYVIAGPNTCSASESVINGLRGVDVDVHIVGGTTCGKPYGFTAKDNCGISYFPIEFKGTNHKGYGDYADGFTPTCGAGDDFAHEIGDDAEGLLNTALNFRATGACMAAAAGGSLRALGARPAAHPKLLRSAVRERRIDRPLLR